MVAVGMELCQHIQELRLGPNNRSLNVSSIPSVRETTKTSYSLCTKLNSYITPNWFSLSNFPIHSEVPTLFHSQNLDFKLPHSFSRLVLNGIGNMVSSGIWVSLLLASIFIGDCLIFRSSFRSFREAQWLAGLSQVTTSGPINWHCGLM